MRTGRNGHRAVALASVNGPFIPVPVKHQRPRGAGIEITNACNLNCVMCNTKQQTRPMALMSGSVFERVAASLLEAGVPSAELHTVGETFVHKRLGDLIAIAERLGLRVGISTNAQFPDKIEDIYRRFPKTANSFRFSIDGATPETYEKIRVGGTFDKVLESFEVIHNINRGLKNSRVFLAVDSILCPDNIGEISKYFDIFGKYTWPEYINFHLVNTLSPDNSFFNSMLPFENLIRPSVPCSLPFHGIWFSHAGKALACCRDYEAEMVIGDTMTQSVTEIWNGSQAEDFRAHQLSGENLPQPCRNCDQPYRFVDVVVNAFIHHLRRSDPRLSPDAFGRRVSALLEDMNNDMATQDRAMLTTTINKHFT